MIVAGKFSNGDDTCNFLITNGVKIRQHVNVYRQAVKSEKENALKGNYNSVYYVDVPDDISVEYIGEKVIYIDTIYEITAFRKNGKIVFVDILESVNYPGSEQGHWLVKDDNEIINLFEIIKFR